MQGKKAIKADKGDSTDMRTIDEVTMMVLEVIERLERIEKRLDGIEGKGKKSLLEQVGERMREEPEKGARMREELFSTLFGSTYET
jgi:hypothetical protein